MLAAKRRRFASAIALIVLLSMLVPAFASAQGSAPGSGGYYYTVKPGDTWSIISRKVGVTVYTLKRYNPRAVHPTNWVYIGERLYVPATGRPQTPPRTEGYWYTVKPGDTWNVVSRLTGVPVLNLWRANPSLLTANRWLYLGWRVWIPSAAARPAPAAEPTAAPVVEVTPEPVAEATAVPTEPASGAAEPTPALVETVIPTAEPAIPLPTPESVATEVPTAEPVATETPTVLPTLEPTGTPTPAPTATTAPTEEVIPVVPTETATAAPVATAAATVPPFAPTVAPAPTVISLKPTPVAGCPADLAEYADASSALLAQPGSDAAKLEQFLTNCGALVPEGGSVSLVTLGGLKGKDIVAAFRDPLDLAPVARGMLLVYHAGDKGYTLARQFEGTGKVEVLKVGDLNLDTKPDIAWSDTSCGAHTCFSTLFVESWDGAVYRDWIVDEPTMAGAKYTFKEVSADTQGEEILVYGGVINSAGAGPQRAWTETYGSKKGGGYELVKQVYDASTCLYHKLQDANIAFSAWTKDGFDPAMAAYQAVIDDTKSVACGTIADELNTLRDFARYRMVVAEVAAGARAKAEALLMQINHAGLRKGADTFLTAYRDSGSVIQACRDTNKFANENPDAWEFLSDWGYANPAFAAEDFCPLQ